jgi:UPF0755 protein
VLLPVIAAALLLIAGIGYYDITSPHTPSRHLPVSIERGASVMQIAAILEEQDVISNRFLFLIAARFFEKSDKLKAGTYLFTEPMSIIGVLNDLAAGRHRIELWVTIPEGLSAKRIAQILKGTSDIDTKRFLDLASDRDYAESLGIDAPGLEGYLFPDTYLFKVHDKPEHIISLMVGRFKSKVDRNMLDRMKKRGRSLHEIMTMASIVEGETRVPGERARVAGVYYNRLDCGMLLQADPTIQYIIPDGPRRLLYEDLRIKSPYNTYRIKGLPPGPINNPGLECIEAAIDPERHGYLFFVANGRGGHTFSRTYEEHNRAVAEYRKLQNKDQ